MDRACMTATGYVQQGSNSWLAVSRDTLAAVCCACLQETWEDVWARMGKV